MIKDRSMYQLLNSCNHILMSKNESQLVTLLQEVMVRRQHELIVPINKIKKDELIVEFAMHSSYFLECTQPIIYSRFIINPSIYDLFYILLV